MGKNSISEIKGNFDLMKKTVSKLRQRFREYIKHVTQLVRAFSSKLGRHWQCFWEPTDEIPFIVKLLLGVLAVAIVAVFVSDSLQRLLSEKYEVLKTIGFCIAGIVSIWLALAANKRANAMDATAKNTEEGQRQERLKNAIEHLGHKRDSVRMGGAYELFHLAEDTEKLRQTVMNILCAHIRQTTTGQTTREKDYQAEYETKPSEEIQSLLTLLFREEHDVFEGCSINLQGSYLNGANLSKARLKDADLREVQLQTVVFMEAKLERAKLSGAQLQGDFLVEAVSQGAILSREQEEYALFVEEQLQEDKRREERLQKKWQ